MHAKAASEKPDDSGFVFGRRWSEESTRKGETFMTAKTKQPPLHIALGYSGISDSEVAAEALAAHDGIKAHPEFFCARKTPAQHLADAILRLESGIPSLAST